MDLPRTMVHALHEQASRRADRPALWTRRGDYYLPTSWREYADRVKLLALGLRQLGFGAGDALAILSFNREEWQVADLAAMALGGVPVGLYTTLSPEQIQYILHHCEAKVVVVENADQLARVLRVRDQCPALRHIVLLDAPGGSLPPDVHRYAEVLQRGRGQDEAPYWRSVNALQPEAMATLIYTSGTTGQPKGVMLSHRNLTWTSERLVRVAEMRDDDVMLSYLPLSHIAEQQATFHCALTAGFQVFFAESLERVPDNLREARPTVFFAVPRVWEKFQARAQQRLAELPPSRARLVRWARGVARQYHTRSLSVERVGLALEAQYAAAKQLVLQQLKQRIGFERTRLFVTSAAPISKEVLEFFASVDIVIREVYGQSEVTGPTTVNGFDSTRLGSLGKPLIGVEVRIAEDGEILVRGENVCMGYYKEPAATAELIHDGWLHSGDVGEFDPEGYLRITGRKKEILVTSGGKKTAPANLELMLKAVSPVGNALVVGDKRKYLVALLAIDPEKARALAKEKGWPEDPQQLVTHADFRRYLDERLQQDVNSRLSRFETIKKYQVLPHDFTIEGGELTPTMKVKRKVAELKYWELLERLYAEDEGPHAVSR